MIKKSKKSLEHGGEYAALLTDLSKVFDCLPQIAELFDRQVSESKNQ